MRSFTQFALFAFAALSVPVQAQVSTVLATLDTVTSNTNALKSTVDGYVQGDSNSAASLITAAAALENSLKDGTQTVQGVAVLTQQESFQLAGPVSNLVTLSNQTVQSTIDKKPVLVAENYGPTTLTTLRNLDAASTAFGDALVSKTDPSLQSLGAQFAQAIKDSFAKGIAAYADQDSASARRAKRGLVWAA